MFNRDLKRRLYLLEKEFERHQDFTRSERWKLVDELEALKRYLGVEYIRTPAKRQMFKREDK